MTPEKQQIEIAEACGWWIDKHCRGLAWNDKEKRALIVTGSKVHEARIKMELPCEPGHHILPDYYHSIDAIREAVLAQDEEFQKRFDARMTNMLPVKRVHERTAADWCAAFLAVLEARNDDRWKADRNMAQLPGSP